MVFSVGIYDVSVVVFRSQLFFSGCALYTHFVCVLSTCCDHSLQSSIHVELHYHVQPFCTCPCNVKVDEPSNSPNSSAFTGLVSFIRQI